jgi:endonuclease-3
MRTSRISRDALKLASSVAPTRDQRPLRQTRSAANATIRAFALNTVEAGDVSDRRERESDNNEKQESDSDLSSVPEDFDSEYGLVAAGGKRKRGQDAPVTTSIKREGEEVSRAAIASPNKVNEKLKKARRAPAKKRVAADGHVKMEPPPNWEEMYTLTRQMRNANIAPVDTMGCESLADRNMSPRDQRFQTLISLMLSSQTKDTVTAVAIKGMQDNMSGVWLLGVEYCQSAD